ncbi:MAG TPA: arylamine N-acetyltransferase [Kofleriaceae bacterium]|nr:arylamine N-acetyltransferase [Kofleriaceae bacterium]
MNLDAYFARIGWRGPRSATGEVLAGLLAHHMRAIPFENFDVLLGAPPSLDLEALEDKLVTRRRGGYCYEHTTLLAAALEQLGFAPKRHAARVIMLTPKESAPRTHMFLTLDGLVLDPGFGAIAPRSPVPIDGEAGAHRLVREGDERVLVFGDQRLWTSTCEPLPHIDFVMANHFTATFPASPFVNRIMARAFTDDGEVRISNRDVTRTRGGQTETFVLPDRRGLREVVAAHFGFDLPALDSVCVPSIPEWASPPSWP